LAVSLSDNLYYIIVKSDKFINNISIKNNMVDAEEVRRRYEKFEKVEDSIRDIWTKLKHFPSLKEVEDSNRVLAFAINYLHGGYGNMKWRIENPKKYEQRLQQISAEARKAGNGGEIPNLEKLISGGN
jgi:L-fucose isomerase-like protein